MGRQSTEAAGAVGGRRGGRAARRRAAAQPRSRAARRGPLPGRSGPRRGPSVRRDGGGAGRDRRRAQRRARRGGCTRSTATSCGPGRHDVPLRFVVQPDPRRQDLHHAPRDGAPGRRGDLRPLGELHARRGGARAPGPDARGARRPRACRIGRRSARACSATPPPAGSTRRSRCGCATARCSDSGEKRPAAQRNWMRVRGRLPDDPLVHTAMLVYATDRTLLATGARPHGLPWGKRMAASLDHAVWIHRAPRSTAGSSTPARVRRAGRARHDLRRDPHARRPAHRVGGPGGPDPRDAAAIALIRRSSTSGDGGGVGCGEWLAFLASRSRASRL